MRGYDPPKRPLLCTDRRHCRPALRLAVRPIRSLMLLKPSGVIPHVGGSTDTVSAAPYYEPLRAWDCWRSEASISDAQRVTKIELWPQNPIVAIGHGITADARAGHIWRRRRAVARRSSGWRLSSRAAIRSGRDQQTGPGDDRPPWRSRRSRLATKRAYSVTTLDEQSWVTAVGISGRIRRPTTLSMSWSTAMRSSWSSRCPANCGDADAEFARRLYLDLDWRAADRRRRGKPLLSDPRRNRRDRAAMI